MQNLEESENKDGNYLHFDTNVKEKKKKEEKFSR